MSYLAMINLESVTARVWIQFDDHGLPYFRIAWRAGPWGSWIEWN